MKSLQNVTSLWIYHLFTSIKKKKTHKIAILTLSDEIVTHLHKQPVHVMDFPSDNASPKAAAEH